MIGNILIWILGVIVVMFLIIFGAGFIIFLINVADDKSLIDTWKQMYIWSQWAFGVGLGGLLTFGTLYMYIIEWR